MRHEYWRILFLSCQFFCRSILAQFSLVKFIFTFFIKNHIYIDIIIIIIILERVELRQCRWQEF